MERRGYQPLPGKLFMVRVPIVATYSDEELELLGIPLSTVIEGSGEYESRRYDKNCYKELTTVMLPLTKIIDIYCAGMRIQLVNHKDTLVIYRLLENYIAGIESTPHMLNMENTVPDERLENIKKFAQEMFAINSGRIADGIADEMSNNNPFKNKIAFMPRVNKPKVLQFQPKKFVDHSPRLDYSLPTEHQRYPFTKPTVKPIEQPNFNYQPIQQEFVQPPVYERPENPTIPYNLTLSPRPKYESYDKKLPHSNLPDFNIKQVRHGNAITLQIDKGD